MEIFIYDPVMHIPEQAAPKAALLEKLGYDGIAMPDHIYVPHFQTGAPNYYADGLTTLAACAVATSRVKLLTLVASNLSRPPVILAQAVATISRLSGGRMELGIGAGWFRPEFDAAGIAFPAGRERIERLVESIEICRSLFTTGRALHEGRHYHVDIPEGAFVPLEHPIRIVAGAAGPRTIRAAASIADQVDFQPDSLQTGTVDFRQYNSYNVELLRAGIESVREVGRSLGRQIPVSESPFVFVAEDAQAGVAERRSMSRWLGLDQDVIDRSLGTIVGTADEVAERLAAYAEAGCDRVHIQALHPEAGERLAPFLPQLKALEPKEGPSHE